MKYKIWKVMANKILIFLIVNIITSFCFCQKNNKSTKGDSLCIEYILHFKPKYVDDKGDSLVVARFPDPSLELIKYLDECIKSQDFSALKYANVVILKLTDEHSKNSKSTYVLDDYGRQNPYIKLVLAYINTKELLEGDIFYFEISQWLFKHRSEINDFKKTKRRFK